MVILSSIPKLDVFQLAEGLNDKQMLSHLYTGFASEKRRLINRFTKRRDIEQIPISRISDLWVMPVLQRYHKSSIYNEMFDRIVASRIRSRKDYKVILAWSGMAEHSLVAAKRADRLSIVARESSHILMQNRILSEEYAKYGLKYKIDKRITSKELREYEIADKIYVCSSFVRQSFLEHGVPAEKLFLNPIAVPEFFAVNDTERDNSKFIILFVGKLSIRKGLRYLFEALEKIRIKESDFEAWFVGAADPMVKQEFTRRKRKNWKYLGFLPQNKLPGIMHMADVGVFPSLEDGFAQVVPQQLRCGLPVITTSNTGSSEIIQQGVNGFVVPPFDSDAIASKLEGLFNDHKLLDELKTNASAMKYDELNPLAVSDRFINFFQETCRNL